jgi:hypothetical protein
MSEGGSEVSRAYKETVKKGRVLLAIAFAFAVIMQFMDIRGYRFNPLSQASARSALAAKLIGLLPEHPAAQYIIILTAAAVLYLLMLQLRQLFIDGKPGFTLRGVSIRPGKYSYGVQMLVAFHVVCYFLSFLIVLLGILFYVQSSIIMELYLCVFIFLILYKVFSPEYEKWERFVREEPGL